jgi:PBSX family phage terminase large subunit
MHKYTDPLDNFLITAPTYKILQQATLPAFLKLMEGYGTFHKVDAMFKMYHGGTCYFRTATDPDSIVGITNVRHVWGDEAGLYSLYFHENIQARAAFKQAPIIYTTSPYSMNWIYTDYIRPFHRGVDIDPEVELVQARSDENPYFPKAEYERKKRTMDPRRFNMVFGGEFHKLEGLVYSCFDEEVHVIEPFTLVDCKIVAGVDWGYTNPAVIEVIAVAPDGTMYVIHEWHKTQKTIGEMADQAAKLKEMLDIERFYCDPSSPANIMEFNKRGLTAIPANNDIRAGIDATFEVISSGKLKVFEGRCPHLLDEISMYHYPSPEDVKPDKDVKDQLPVKQYDHTMDAIRYAVYAQQLVSSHKRKKPVVPGHKEKIARGLTRPKNLIMEKDTKEYDW